MKRARIQTLTRVFCDSNGFAPKARLLTMWNGIEHSISRHLQRLQCDAGISPQYCGRKEPVFEHRCSKQSNSISMTSGSWHLFTRVERRLSLPNSRVPSCCLIHFPAYALGLAKSLTPPDKLPLWTPVLVPLKYSLPTLLLLILKEVLLHQSVAGHGFRCDLSFWYVSTVCFKPLAEPNANLPAVLFSR